MKHSQKRTFMDIEKMSSDEFIVVQLSRQKSKLFIMN